MVRVGRAEGRKLQRTGGSTYVVSLPKRWVTRARLQPGDIVFLAEAGGGTLVLSPGDPGRRSSRRLALKVEDAGDAREKLLRELIGGYVSGADVVEIQFSPDVVTDVRRTVRDFSRLVIGPEILEEGRSSMVVQDLSDTKELSQERCLRRMHLITVAMQRDALHALVTGDTTLAADVVARDEDVDRLFWMVAKQFSLDLLDPSLAAEHGGDPGGNLSLRLAAKSLERIADHAARIASHAAALEGRRPRRDLTESLRRASDIALSVLEQAFEALVSTDLEKANDAITAKRALDRVFVGITAVLQNLRGSDLLHYAAIAESLVRTADYATDIAETAINHVVMRRLGEGR